MVPVSSARPCAWGAIRRRSIARIAGALFVITFVTSIAALLLYDPVLNDRGYITGSGADTRVFLAAFLDLLLIVANIGTAVLLFPILKRQRESSRSGSSPPGSWRARSSPSASSASWRS